MEKHICTLHCNHVYQQYKIYSGDIWGEENLIKSSWFEKKNNLWCNLYQNNDSIIDGNVLKVSFPNIMLPDSNVNESDGIASDPERNVSESDGSASAPNSNVSDSDGSSLCENTGHL